MGLHKSACRTNPEMSRLVRWSSLPAGTSQVCAGHSNPEAASHAVEHAESRKYETPKRLCDRLKCPEHARYRAVDAHDGRNTGDVMNRPNKRAPTRRSGWLERAEPAWSRPGRIVILGCPLGRTAFAPLASWRIISPKGRVCCRSLIACRCLGSEEFQQFRSECFGGHVMHLALKDAVGCGRDGSGDCLARVDDPCGAVRPVSTSVGWGNASQPAAGSRHRVPSRPGRGRGC